MVLLRGIFIYTTLCLFLERKKCRRSDVHADDKTTCRHNSSTDSIWRLHDDSQPQQQVSTSSQLHDLSADEQVADDITTKDIDSEKEDGGCSEIKVKRGQDSNEVKVKDEVKQGHQSVAELLLRLFPHVKTNALRAIIEGCQGDVTQAIERVLSCQREGAAVATSSMASSTATSKYLLAGHAPTALHNAYLSAAATAHAPYGSVAALKSVLSPPGQSPPALAAAFRYPYGHNPRGMPLGGGGGGGLYSPHFFPGLAGFGYSYGTMAAAAAAAASVAGGSGGEKAGAVTAMFNPYLCSPYTNRSLNK